MSYGAAGVTVEFDGVPALRDVTVSVEAGSVVAVVGGDGAGKSTLLRCFTGEVFPARGEIDRPDKARLGYMPSSSGTWRDLTVGENFDLVERVFRLDRATAQARRSDLLTQAGLAEAQDRLAGELSGGMRQKLGFCLVILHEPDLLVLDEPSTGVDAVSRLELWQLIADAAARGAAVLLATTYLDEAERAERVLVLDNGNVLALGTPRDIIAREAPQIFEVDHPTDARLSWRRGRVFHEWQPHADPSTSRLSVADLEDAVIASILRSQLGAGGDEP